MSSPVEQFPADPGGPADPDDPRHDAHAHRRRRTLQEQAQATLAKKVARAARSHRKIAKATARRARAVADLQQCSCDPVNAKLLNPDYAFRESRALPEARSPVLTDAQASPRKIAAWEHQEIARRTVTSEVAYALRLAERTRRTCLGNLPCSPAR